MNRIIILFKNSQKINFFYIFATQTQIEKTMPKFQLIDKTISGQILYFSLHLSAIVKKNNNFESIENNTILIDQFLL